MVFIDWKGRSLILRPLRHRVPGLREYYQEKIVKVRIGNYGIN